MLKEWLKAGEIKETLQAIGKVKEGDKHFELAEGLRMELSGIRKFVAKRILILIGVLALGSIAAIKALSDNETEDKGQKEVVSKIDPDDNDSVDSCKLTDEDLKARADEFFEMSTLTGTEPEFQKAMHDLSAVNRDIIRDWQKIIQNTGAFHKNQLAGRVADFFCSGAVPMLIPKPENIPVPDQSEFLVANTKSAETNPRTEWLQARGLVFADTSKRILYLSGGRENDVLAFLEVMEMMPKAGNGDEGKTGMEGIVLRELSTISGRPPLEEFLEAVAEGVDKFDVSTHFPYWLKEIAEANLVAEKAESVNKKLETRMYIIAKLLMKLWADNPRFANVVCWLGQAIESPRVYLVPVDLPENYSSNNFVNILNNNRLKVVRRNKYGVSARDHLASNNADPNFMRFMWRVVVPVFRDLTKTVRSGVEKKLFYSLIEDGIADIDPEAVIKRSAIDQAQGLEYLEDIKSDGFLDLHNADFGSRPLLVSPLDSPGYQADERRKWMEEHGISYFDDRRDILFLPAGKAKYPYPSETIYTDVMMSFNRGLSCNERLEAGVKYTSGVDPFLEYTYNFLRPDADGEINDVGLTFLVRSLNSRAIGTISRQIELKSIIFPEGLSESEAVRMKTLAVEAYTYRIVADLRDFGCSSVARGRVDYRKITDKLGEMLDNPHKWFGLSEMDKRGHALFKPQAVHK